MREAKIMPFTRQIKDYLDELKQDNFIDDTQYDDLLKDALAIYIERYINESINRNIEKKIDNLIKRVEL